MQKLIIITMISVLMFSCSSRDEQESKLLFTNNMDNLYAWNENLRNNIIKVDNAHSGNYVNKIYSDNPYSTCLYLRLGDINSTPLEKLNVSCWIWISDKKTLPTLIVDIMDKDKKSFDYIATDLRQDIKAVNKWTKIHKEFNLKEKNRNATENYIKVYFSNVAPESCIIDDITVDFSN